jgi:demethylmenaquinone methyltransferase/2-methoxy-6-polyprenyl-1,4-benzoquinol methylase
MFADIAGSYDLLNHLLSLNRDRRWRRQAAERGRPAGPVLDVCAGTGDMALEWARNGRRGAVYASDFCVEMLERCRRKAGDGSEVRLLAADARHLPFPSDVFGTVSVAFGIRNVEDLGAGLAELARVTRPGGQVRVLEFTMPDHPLFRAVYLFYFLFVLPVLGNLISGSEDGAYGYLPRSVLRFPASNELAALMGRAGLGSVTVENLSMGIVNLLIGVKEV